MGKNAYVIEHHHGDDGTVSEGKILRDITTKRFDELEKKGLVREATDAEVEAGDQHAFEKDTSGDNDGQGSAFTMKHKSGGKFVITGPGLPEDGEAVQGKEAAQARLAALQDAAGEKQAATPENKQAPEPANKGA